MKQAAATYKKDYRTAGRWAGNRIVIIGDYNVSRIYQRARVGFFEISREIIDDFNDFVKMKAKKLRYRPEEGGNAGSP